MAKFAGPVEDAHGLSAWYEHDSLVATIVVELGGRSVLHGELSMETGSDRGRIERAGGATVVWSGDDVWLSTTDDEFPRARYHAMTWPLYLRVPMMLRDPGTYLVPLGEKSLGGKTYDAARLTFAPEVHSALPDELRVYRDRASGRLHAIRHVAGDGDGETAVVTFRDFRAVSGVYIPREWTIWSVDAEQELGEPVGAVRLSDVRFETATDGAVSSSSPSVPSPDVF